METTQKITRLFWLYVASIVGAFVLSVCVFVIGFGSGLFDALFGVGVINLPTIGALSILMAVPLGCSLGIYILDRTVYGAPTSPIWRVLFAFLGGYAGLGLSYIVMPILLSHYGHYEGLIITFLPPFIVGFMSVIGYLLPGLFGRKESGMQTSTVFFGRILPLGILMILVSVAFYLSVTWQKEKIDAVKETERSIRFLGQFLSSINEGTDFYKNHSTEAVLQEIQTYRSKISKNYERRDNYDTTKKGWYECHIIFDEKQLFLAGIDTSQSDCVMGDFNYLGTTRKQTQSEPLRTGDATKFFRRILASINKETDFYKKHSTEPAIQEIEAYHSMISSNYVLYNRETKAWDEFDFYVEFDGKNKFRLNIDGSKGGFILRSFTYIREK